jgi:uncharacterized protein (DUF1330 family)
MKNAYVVGHLTVKQPALWAEYRSKVPSTLIPWDGDLMFRGRLVASLVGEMSLQDIVVIRFPDLAAIYGWFASPAYQVLIPLRQQAAEMTLHIYEG